MMPLADSHLGKLVGHQGLDRDGFLRGSSL